MESWSKVLAIATLFFGLFLSQSAQTIAEGNNQKLPQKTWKLMQDVCKESGGDYQTCMLILRFNPQISSVTDMISLANVALKVTRQETTDMQAFLEQTIESNPKASQALKSCVNFFGETIRPLVISKEELVNGEASYNVHTAMDSVTSCETTLTDAKVNIKAVTDRINKWKNFFIPAAAAVDQAENILHVIT